MSVVKSVALWPGKPTSGKPMSEPEIESITLMTVPTPLSLREPTTTMPSRQSVTPSPLRSAAVRVSAGNS